MREALNPEFFMCEAPDPEFFMREAPAPVVLRRSTRTARGRIAGEKRQRALHPREGSGGIVVCCRYAKFAKRSLKGWAVMARYPDANEVYAVAELFASECLFHDGSLLWPGNPVWTSENLNAFWTAFAEHPDESRDDFVTKLANQLARESVEIFRMAVEVAAVYCLFPDASQFGATAKRRLISQILNFRSDLGEMDADRWQMVDSAFDQGIGNPGIGYLTGRPFHIGYFLAFAKAVKASGAREFGQLDPAQVTADALRDVSDTMKFSPRASVNIALHLFWPDRYEGTASVDYKARMAAGLSARFNLKPLDNVDDTISQARRHMESIGYPQDFNMYSNEVRPLWDEDAPEPSGKTHQKFELATLLRQRVLENNDSFLWPDVEDAWIPENVQRAWEAVKGLKGLGYAEANSRLIEITKTCDHHTYQVLCDTRAMYNVRSVIQRGAAENEFVRLLDAQGTFDGDRGLVEQILASSDETFPGSIAGTAGTPMIDHYLIILLGILSVLENPTTIGDRDAMVAAFERKCDSENLDLHHFPFYTILFLMYPELFASVPGWSDRQRVLHAFDKVTEGKEYPNQQAQLAAIREYLEPDFDPVVFDFYDEPYRSMWNSRSVTPGPSRPGPTSPEETTHEETPTIADLAAETYLDPGFLGQIERLLAEKKQLIFEGPPGSGKTFVAEKFARYFTGQPLSGADRNEQIELVQFHQSYSYEDFVEGIRPRTNEDGQLVYDIEKGIFRRFAETAEANPDKRFVLIIDEVNRGNLSRILGELMLLLEYRNQSSTLPYSKDKLQIPENLYIIGTMNSADRSLSQIDYALRRRFFFMRFMSVEQERAPVLEGWLKPRTSEWERVVSLFIALNAQLRSHLATDDLQVGHSYFMRHDIHKRSVQDEVWQYAVMPLLREYLYHHRDRDTMLQQYQIDALMQQAVSGESLIAETDPDDV